jgi:hypothetical protein
MRIDTEELAPNSNSGINISVGVLCRSSIQLVHNKNTFCVERSAMEGEQSPGMHVPRRSSRVKVTPRVPGIPKFEVAMAISENMKPWKWIHEENDARQQIVPSELCG